MQNICNFVINFTTTSVQINFISLSLHMQLCICACSLRWKDAPSIAAPQSDTKVNVQLGLGLAVIKIKNMSHKPLKCTILSQSSRVCAPGCGWFGRGAPRTLLSYAQPSLRGRPSYEMIFHHISMLTAYWGKGRRMGHSLRMNYFFA